MTAQFDQAAFKTKVATILNVEASAITLTAGANSKYEVSIPSLTTQTSAQAITTLEGQQAQLTPTGATSVQAAPAQAAAPAPAAPSGGNGGAVAAGIIVTLIVLTVGGLAVVWWKRDMLRETKARPLVNALENVHSKVFPPPKSSSDHTLSMLCTDQQLQSIADGNADPSHPEHSVEL